MKFSKIRVMSCLIHVLYTHYALSCFVLSRYCTPILPCLVLSCPGTVHPLCPVLSYLVQVLYTHFALFCPVLNRYCTPILPYPALEDENWYRSGEKHVTQILFRPFWGSNAVLKANIENAKPYILKLNFVRKKLRSWGVGSNNLPPPSFINRVWGVNNLKRVNSF